MTRLLLLFIICLGCADKANQNHSVGEKKQEMTNDKDSTTNIHETQLVESNYFIQLPDTFKVSIARGKEGQIGYNIFPKDTSSTMYGFIEINAGYSIDDTPSPTIPAKETFSSYLLGKKVQWKIYKTETGYFDASTNEKGNINASASSKKRNEIDSLVAIISTLMQK